MAGGRRGGQAGAEGGAACREGERGRSRAGAAQVVAYGSGNLAQVYFDLYPRRILLSELNAAFPGVVDALVQHEAIGLVAATLDADTPVVLSKGRQAQSASPAR